MKYIITRQSWSASVEVNCNVRTRVACHVRLLKFGLSKWRHKLHTRLFASVFPPLRIFGDSFHINIFFLSKRVSVPAIPRVNLNTSARPCWYENQLTDARFKPRQEAAINSSLSLALLFVLLPSFWRQDTPTGRETETFSWRNSVLCDATPHLRTARWILPATGVQPSTKNAR